MAGQVTDRIPPVTDVTDGARRLQAMALTMDAVNLKKKIRQAYGFTPTEEYCRDLIAFVDRMTHEPGK